MIYVLLLEDQHQRFCGDALDGTLQQGVFWCSRSAPPSSRVLKVWHLGTSGGNNRLIRARSAPHRWRLAYRPQSDIWWLGRVGIAKMYRVPPVDRVRRYVPLATLANA